MSLIQKIIVISSYLASENPVRYDIKNFHINRKKLTNRQKRMSLKLNKQPYFSYHRLMNIFVSVFTYQDKLMLCDICSTKINHNSTEEKKENLNNPKYIENNIITDLNSLIDLNLLKSLKTNESGNILTRKLMINFDIKLVIYLTEQLDMKLNEFLDL